MAEVERRTVAEIFGNENQTIYVQTQPLSHRGVEVGGHEGANYSPVCELSVGGVKPPAKFSTPVRFTSSVSPHGVD